MPSFRGKRVNRTNGAGAGRGDQPHPFERISAEHDARMSMTFDELHAQASKGKGPREGLFLRKTDKSPYSSQNAVNYAREQHNADRAKKREAERPKTVEEEYG